jgi:N-acetylmuramoyl-L-alanine amidase
LDTIVLDPGHGGRDEGVRGPSGLLEKDVTLKLAQHLSALLKARLGLRVIQTRSGDVSLPLSERTSLANHAKAQLFISIHLEGSFRRETEGFRLYTFSPAPAGEGAAPEGAEGVEAILWDLAQTAFSNESARLAELMAESLERRIGLRRAGIAKAPLFPLRGAQMPAVLVSPAHLSNAKEELLLRDEAFLQKVAEGLYEALLNFMAGRDVAE